MKIDPTNIYILSFVMHFQALTIRQSFIEDITLMVDTTSQRYHI